MNLQESELAELNGLLKEGKYGLPAFRNSVQKSGTNYKWLQKNLPKVCQDINPRLVELLRLKKRRAACPDQKSATE